MDILHCEVYCDSLPEVQRVWTSLSTKLQSEEQSVRIVALWDGFAQEEQMRCSKIIVSIEGSSLWKGLFLFGAFQGGYYIYIYINLYIQHIHIICKTLFHEKE